MLRGDPRQIGERLKNNIVKFGITTRQRACVQFFGAAQCFVIFFFCVQQLLRSSVPAICICKIIIKKISTSQKSMQKILEVNKRKILPPTALYCLAESSMSKTSPCKRATSAEGSTSALEPASNNRGLQTRYFKSTGATTAEIAPGDDVDNCNRK